MICLYNEEVVDDRIKQIKGGYEDNLDEADDKQGKTYGSVFCDPLFSRASFVGCCLAIIQ